MNLAVCLTQVPDTAARLKISTDSQTIDSEGISFVLNPYDEYALEEALQVKGSVLGARVTVFCVGDDSFQPTIRKAFAMGADDAVLIENQTYESFDVANALANVIRAQFNGLPDIIFLGKESIATNDAQVGAMLGELLQMPAVCVVTSFKLEGSLAKLEREIEGGSELLEIELPLILTAQKGLNLPRQPNMKGMMLAKKKQILKQTADMSAAGKTHNTKLELPPKKAPGKILETVKQLVDALKHEASVI
ncbi:Electron transfer flavoprotein alpha/beta-subunit [Chloroherpeton thalassium ATCC 35110]|uniref:Electron transfer flavoprotein alpha/beta-subunit n=1 Tax=Chloroherpeton thalassium (strain ATCC 35110 / GB-78) TaxID=517418 RepID=B3QTQ9_CHLT3|nr:electron transfer flavoprotein subunit beta/FixA family protein [Chloroherpeton thalassium]ACF14257.1 Electron transfer flavoprotein alpha/beta-subunit [Chloroherpeton thalassium ATCC 35110]